MKRFSDLKTGDRIYCIDNKNHTIEISEIKRVSTNISFSETPEFDLIPIIGN